MQNNTLRMAIRATAALTAFGIAAQVQAVEISAGDVKADIYGYARLNTTYDINEDIAGPALEGTFTSISGSDNEGHFAMTANQSRLGVNIGLPKDVNVKVEGDFYKGNFRLRHAYGEYNGLLAGQTWSNYNSFTGNTPTLDFNGSAGWAGYQLRTSQVRYTTGGLSVSAEQPVGWGDATAAGAIEGVANDNEKDTMPALTARYETSMDALSLSAAGLVKQVAYDNGVNDDSALGYGIFGAAKFAVSDAVSIQGSLNYTDGANSYLYLSYGADAYLDGNDVETISGMAGSIGTSVSLGGGRSVNLMYGMAKLDLDDAVAAGESGANETNQNVILNYMWTPVQNVMMGVELSHWATEANSGDSEEANRIMYSAQYNF
jgi:hypothetical protein